MGRPGSGLRCPFSSFAPHYASGSRHPAAPAALTPPFKRGTHTEPLRPVASGAVMGGHGKWSGSHRAANIRCTKDITALGEEGKWEEAHSKFEELKTSGVKPDLLCYSALISSFGTNGRWEEAE